MWLFGPPGLGVWRDRRQILLPPFFLLFPPSLLLPCSMDGERRRGRAHGGTKAPDKIALRCSVCVWGSGRLCIHGRWETQGTKAALYLWAGSKGTTMAPTLDETTFNRRGEEEKKRKRETINGRGRGYNWILPDARRLVSQKPTTTLSLWGRERDIKEG